jgi:hypothetical protein
MSRRELLAIKKQQMSDEQERQKEQDKKRNDAAFIRFSRSVVADPTVRALTRADVDLALQGAWQQLSRSTDWKCVSSFAHARLATWTN